MGKFRNHPQAHLPITFPGLGLVAFWYDIYSFKELYTESDMTNI